MTTESLEAWVLHQIPSGDSSARVTFFTPEKGIFPCFCKGGRSPKKQALLQPFLPLWLAVDRRKDWYFVRRIETLAAALSIKGHALFASLYVNELVYYSLKPLDPQPELFKAYLDVMQGLTAVHDKLAIEILLRRFEWSLLQACGYSLSLTERANSAGPISPNGYYQFLAGEGFIPADKGIAGADLLALAEGRLEPQSLKTAKLIMRKAIDHLLGGRVLKSRSLAQFSYVKKVNKDV